MFSHFPALFGAWAVALGAVLPYTTAAVASALCGLGDACGKGCVPLFVLSCPGVIVASCAMNPTMTLANVDWILILCCCSMLIHLVECAWLSFLLVSAPCTAVSLYNMDAARICSYSMHLTKAFADGAVHSLVDLCAVL